MLRLTRSRAPSHLTLLWLLTHLRSREAAAINTQVHTTPEQWARQVFKPSQVTPTPSSLPVTFPSIPPPHQHRDLREGIFLGDEKRDADGDERVLGDKEGRMLDAEETREMSEKRGDEDKRRGGMLEAVEILEMSEQRGDEEYVRRKRMLDAEETREMSEKREDEDGSLGRMLEAVVKREMSECQLLIAFDSAYDKPFVLAPLMALPNPRQVVRVRELDDLLGVTWGTEGCRGYLILLGNAAPLLRLSEGEQLTWDYRGRYLCVLPSRNDLMKLATSPKGRKTEHLAGVIKGRSAGAWRVYVGRLYQGVAGEVARVSTWRGDRFSSPALIYQDRLTDLKGARLKAVTFEWAPSVFYYRDSAGSVVFRYGTDIGVLDTIARVMNFSVEYEEPPLGEWWGREEENGNWSGMMGRLARNEVDIGLVDLYVTHVRIGILDYTTPYDSELSCFMARTEPPLPRWQALAFPFSSTTWVAIAVGLVVAGPVLALLARGAALCGEEVKSLQSLAASWYYALALHCCEAQVSLPRMQSTRIFVATLWLYTTIITIIYSTNLTAFLLVAKPPQTIESIRDLHASGLEVSAVGSFYGDALLSASDPYLQSLHQNFRPYGEASEIFPRVLSGAAVMIQNSPFLEFVAATRFSRRGQSRMRLMKECFAPFSIAMSVQRHSPLKAPFDRIIGWVNSAGLPRFFFLRSLRVYRQNEI
ncbi:ionotropic receptor 21a-like [Eriocheir sinensis]|uniref:ionotropic receptor 21a-like n=1 Tax=Eriocheir sinensis TaxID=95602 RepID=UPI0021C602F4|nr:ionotropic receptor 21a-like [Eriocheir sinensis]